MQAKELRAWRTEFEHVSERIADCLFGVSHGIGPERIFKVCSPPPLERKNGWQLAESAGDHSPDGIQDFLARPVWDADTVRDQLRDYVVGHLGEPEAVLVLDETGFVKKGVHSAGVRRQYSGTAGRIENRQIGVFMAYASRRGYAFIDRELYLPGEWTQDAKRRQAAHVPEAVVFRTKLQIGRAMLQRALKAGVPFAWVTADSVYGGSSRLRQTMVEAGRSYVLAVQSNRVWGWPGQTVARYANGLPTQAWMRISCGPGAKGPPLYDWAYLKDKPNAGGVHGLLIRRHRRRHRDRAYYLTYAPGGISLAKLVEVAGGCWAIESGFEQAKGEVGLDQYEVRRYDAWHRHITLALLAHAYLIAVRASSAGKNRPGTAARALAAHRAGSTLAPCRLSSRPQHIARNDQGMVEVATSAPAARQAMLLGRPAPKAA